LWKPRDPQSCLRPCRLPRSSALPSPRRPRRSPFCDCEGSRSNPLIGLPCPFFILRGLAFFFPDVFFRRVWQGAFFPFILESFQSPFLNFFVLPLELKGIFNYHGSDHRSPVFLFFALASPFPPVSDPGQAACLLSPKVGPRKLVNMPSAFRTFSLVTRGGPTLRDQTLKVKIPPLMVPICHGPAHFLFLLCYPPATPSWIQRYVLF